MDGPDGGALKPVPITAGPGQESAWDYPRPPRLEPTDSRVTVELGGVIVVRTRRALRVLETSHPPVYYLPVADFLPGSLAPTTRTTWCEFKGTATYYSVSAGGRVEPDAAWGYPHPVPGFEALVDRVAVYAGRMDACFVEDEGVEPQPGAFYGGWITSRVVGPFKGGPGTSGW